MCKEGRRMWKEFEQRMHDIAEDPFAIDGGVVGELQEDYEQAFAVEMRDAFKKGKVCAKCAGEFLGEIAQNRFERKVYGGG